VHKCVVPECRVLKEFGGGQSIKKKRESKKRDNSSDVGQEKWQGGQQQVCETLNKSQPRMEAIKRPETPGALLSTNESPKGSDPSEKKNLANEKRKGTLTKKE